MKPRSITRNTIPRLFIVVCRCLDISVSLSSLNLFSSVHSSPSSSSFVASSCVYTSISTVPFFFNAAICVHWNHFTYCPLWDSFLAELRHVFLERFHGEPWFCPSQPIFYEFPDHMREERSVLHCEERLPREDTEKGSKDDASLRNGVQHGERNGRSFTDGFHTINNRYRRPVVNPELSSRGSQGGGCYRETRKQLEALSSSRAILDADRYRPVNYLSFDQIVLGIFLNSFIVRLKIDHRSPSKTFDALTVLQPCNPLDAWIISKEKKEENRTDE